MLNTVLAVDIGTSSLKAGLIAANGEDVFVCRQKYSSADSRYIGSKWFHYLEAAMRKINDAVDQLSTPIEIIAISISGNGPTLVSDTGLTLKWNEEINPAVQNKLTEEGKKSLFIPRILTFKENFPEEYKKSKYIFSGPEYLVYQLIGKAITILPEERYKTAYWTDETLVQNGIEVEKMPPFMTVGQKYGKLTEEAAAALTLEPGLPVYGAGPDFIAALIGTGTIKPGILCDRSGSSEGLNFCVDKPIFAEGIRTLPSVVPGLWNISVLIPQSSKLPEEERLEKVAEAINYLKKLCKENNIEFPDSMKVTGGQTANKFFLQKKANKVGLRLAISKCKHSELLGDAKVVWQTNESI